MHYRIALLFMIVSALRLQAQKNGTDTIYLMNGHMVAKQVLDTTMGAVTISDPENPLKKIHFEFDQLYMVHYVGGKRRYYYVQDSTIGNWLTRDQMWMYMKGENDARKGFKARGAFYGSIVAGVAGGMTGTLWGPLAPFGFMMLTGLPRVKIEASTVSDPRNVEHDAYLMGYERVARHKMRIRAVVGGTIGLAAGYLFYGLFHSKYPESVGFMK